MVENTITDGKRIGQFLASELTGLDGDLLSRVDVADADPDAEPSPAGTEAYTVTLDGEAVAVAVLLPEAVELRRTEGTWEQPTAGRGIGVREQTLTIESVAVVKQAVDCLAATVASTRGEPS
jgi:hypothetical protein